jgi:hypothetical protein
MIIRPFGRNVFENLEENDGIERRRWLALERFQVNVPAECARFVHDLLVELDALVAFAIG